MFIGFVRYYQAKNQAMLDGSLVNPDEANPDPEAVVVSVFKHKHL